jgi:putative hydrolase of the HAD superfamily
MRGVASLEMPATGKHLVFDFAGVVFSWQPRALLQRVIPQHATDEASARQWAGQIFEDYGGDWADFDRGTVSPDDLVVRIARRTGLAEAHARAVVQAVPLAFQPIAGTVDLLQRLRRPGRPLFFLSNMPAPYADYLDRHYPVAQWFGDGVYSGRVQLIKPEPAMYALAASRFGVAPADLVFFDDVAGNVAAAQAAGWSAFLFTGAARAERDLRQAGWWPEPG